MSKLFKVNVMLDVAVLAESPEMAEALLRDNTVDWLHELFDADYSATEVVSMAQIPEWDGCLPYSVRGEGEKWCEEYLDPPDAVYVYVIYRPTNTDHPGKWVLRRWRVSAGNGIQAEAGCSVHDSLESARRMVPPGLTYVTRMDHDDPCIEETWI